MDRVTIRNGYHEACEVDKHRANRRARAQSTSPSGRGGSSEVWSKEQVGHDLDWPPVTAVRGDVRSRHRASLSALDRLSLDSQQPVTGRLRRILSVQDISHAGDDRASPRSIYDQMRELCSSRADLTDVLNERLGQAGGGTTAPPRHARPKHPPTSHLEVFVDELPRDQKVYRPIARRRRHHRLKMERRAQIPLAKLAVHDDVMTVKQTRPDDITNNNHPITNRTRFSTLDRLVREQRSEYDLPWAEMGDEPVAGQGTLDTEGTLDRLAKRAHDSTVSGREFQQLCAVNQNLSENGTPTSSPRLRPKIFQQEIQLDLKPARNKEICQNESIFPTEERRPSVKDAICLFEKLKGKPRRVASESRTQVRHMSGVFADESNVDDDSNMTDSGRMRNSDNSFGSSENLGQINRYQSQSPHKQRAPETVGSARDGQVIKIIEPPITQNRTDRKRTPPPRRFIVRDSSEGSDFERRHRRSPRTGRNNDPRSPSDLRVHERIDAENRDGRVRYLSPQPDRARCRKSPLNSDPEKPELPPRKARAHERSRMPVPSHHESESESSHSNDERLSVERFRQVRLEERRERNEQHRKKLRDSRSSRGEVLHPVHAEVRDSRSVSDAGPGRVRQSGSDSADFELERRHEIRGDYPSNYPLHRSLTPQYPPDLPERVPLTFEGRESSWYEIERHPHEDWRSHPEDSASALEAEPPYPDRYCPHYHAGREQAPSTKRDVYNIMHAPRPKLPIHSGRAHGNTSYDYGSPARYAEITERGLPNFPPEHQLEKSPHEFQTKVPDKPYVDSARFSQTRAPQFIDMRSEYSPLRGSLFDRCPDRRLERSMQAPAPEPYLRGRELSRSEYHDRADARVNKSHQAYPGPRVVPPGGQVSDPENQYPRPGPEFMQQAIQYGYRPYTDHPGSRRSYPCYPNPYYPYGFHGDFPVPYYFPDERGSVCATPERDILVRPDQRYPYPRDLNIHRYSPWDQTIRSVVGNRAKRSPHETILNAFNPTKSLRQNPANEFYSDFSLGKPCKVAEGYEQWHYGDPRNVTTRPSKNAESNTQIYNTHGTDSQTAMGRDTVPPRPWQLVADLSEGPRERESVVEYQPIHALSPRSKRPERGLEIHKTRAENLDSSRMELDQALEDLSLVASIEIPKQTTENRSDHIARAQVNKHIVYDRVSDTVIRRCKSSAADQDVRDNILAERGVIFHNISPAARAAVPQPARHGLRVSSETKVEGKVRAKRPSHLPVKSGYKNGLSCSVPNLKTTEVSCVNGLHELDAVLDELKLFSLLRKKKNNQTRPSYRSTNSESDSSVFSDAVLYPERPLRDEVSSAPSCAEYVWPRQQQALPGDMDFRPRSDTEAAFSPHARAAIHRPVRSGVQRVIAKLADADEASDQITRSLPDLSNVANHAKYNYHGQIASDDQKFSRPSRAERKMPRHLKARRKMRALLTDSTATNESSDSPGKPLSDQLQEEDSAISEDATQEFQAVSRPYYREPFDSSVFQRNVKGGRSLRKSASHDELAGRAHDPSAGARGEMRCSWRGRSGSDPCLSEKDGLYRSVLHFSVGSE